MADLFEDSGANYAFKRITDALNRAAREGEAVARAEQNVRRSAEEAAQAAERARAEMEAVRRAARTPGIGQPPGAGGSYAAPPPGGIPQRQIGPARIAGELPVRTGSNYPRFYAGTHPGDVYDPHSGYIGRQQLQLPRGRPGTPEGIETPASLARTAQAARAAEDAERASQSLAAAKRAETSAWKESAVAIGGSADQYRRNGALTTEFIAAARRGEVTFRELGYQVSSTIGKFAGWTAAATAVYGAVAAFDQLYQGALKAQDGIALIERVTSTNVDRGALSQQFRDLSGEFNLPIEQVTDSVYQLTKLFGGDLPAALQASRVSLQAMQIGELDVTQATNALNSVVKGFGLSAGDLQTVFDAVNQAQQKFGGNTGDLLVNLAKVGAAARQAGVDTKQALAFLVTGTQYGGRTGSVVATAFQRSTQTVRSAKGRERLADLGIEEPFGPDYYNRVLAAAAKKYQAANSQQRQNIAKALVPTSGQSGAFAPLLESILKDYDKYSNVLRKVSNDADNAATRQRELAKFLGSPSQQIKELTVNLQRLGASLASSGALDPILALAAALNLSLKAANALFESFSRLPDPLSKALLYGAELVALLKLAQRFDLGGGRGGLARPFNRPQGAVIGKTIDIGLRDQRALVDEEIRGTRSKLGRTQLQRSIYQTQADTLAAGPQDKATRERIKTANQKVADLTAREAVLKGELDVLVQEGTALEAQANEYRALRNKGLSAEAAAAQTGITVRRGTLDSPDTLNPTAPVGAAAAAEEQAKAAAAADAEAVAAGAAIGRASSEWEKAKAKTRGLAAKLRGVGAFVAENMNELLLAALIIPTIVESISHHVDEFNKILDEGASPSPGELRARAEKIKVSPIDYIPTGVSKVLDFAQNFVPIPNNAVDVVGIKNQQKKSLEGEAKGIAEARKRGLLLTLAQIQKEAADNLANTKDADARKEIVRNALRELERSYAAIFGGKDAKRGQRDLFKRLTDQLKNPAKLQDALGGAEEQKEFEKAQAVYNARTELYASRIKSPVGKIDVQLKRTQARTNDIIRVYGKDSSEYLDQLTKINTLRDQRFEAVQAQIDAKANAAAASTGDPIEALRIQIKANAEKIGRAADEYGKNSAQYLEAFVQGKQLNKQLITEQLSRYTATANLNTTIANRGASQGQQLKNEIGKATGILSEARRIGVTDPKELAGLQQQVEQAKNSYADYLKQQAQALIDANAEFAKSRTEDPLKEGKIELDRLRAQAKYARTPAERRSAKAQINEQIESNRNLSQQRKFDDIEFNLSMERITKDTAIAQFEALARSMHGNRELRRTILQRVKALKDEAKNQSDSFDLDVGSLKLPTIYDVRKGFDPIREQLKANVQKKGSFLRPADASSSDGGSTTTQVNVYVNDKNDAPAVYDAIDRAVGTTVRARMRSRKQR